MKPTADRVRAPTQMLEMAWGLIANASGGNWSKESKEWQDAAAAWRDRWCSAPQWPQDHAAALAEALRKAAEKFREYERIHLDKANHLAYPPISRDLSREKAAANRAIAEEMEAALAAYDREAAEPVAPHEVIAEPEAWACKACGDLAVRSTTSGERPCWECPACHAKCSEPGQCHVDPECSFRPAVPGPTVVHGGAR